MADIVDLSMLADDDDDDGLPAAAAAAAGPGPSSLAARRTRKRVAFVELSSGGEDGGGEEAGEGVNPETRRSALDDEVQVISDNKSAAREVQVGIPPDRAGEGQAPALPLPAAAPALVQGPLQAPYPVLPPAQPALPAPKPAPALVLDAARPEAALAQDGEDAPPDGVGGPNDELPPAPPLAPAEHRPVDEALAHLLILFPDIDPYFARSTAECTLAALASGNSTAQAVVEAAAEVIFAVAEGYPRVKRKRAAEDGGGEQGEGKKAREEVVDYGSVKRKRLTGEEGGRAYDELSVGALSEAFVWVPIPHIKAEFHRTHLYAPTYLKLLDQQKMVAKPFKPKKVPTPIGKGKGKARISEGEPGWEAWEREDVWIKEKLANDAAAVALAESAARAQAELEASGLGVECACCFDTVAFEKCGQCDEGHLFCTDCVEGYAKEKIGSQTTDIKCMDGSGCSAPFSEAELRRVLPEKLVAQWERLQQQKHVAAAGLEGLESCPFCDFSLILDNPLERLFTCLSDACGAVSCRACKREDHLPRTCDEVAAEDKLDHRHAVEEAMTQALIRMCPNKVCGRPTVKESGCNKMLCSACRTLFCYVCNKICTGYEHFDQQPSAYHLAKNKHKCPLWDDLGERTDKELREARKKAMEELRAQGVEVDGSMEVDLPEKPAAPSRPGAHIYRPPPARVNYNPGPQRLPQPPHNVAAVFPPGRARPIGVPPPLPVAAGAAPAPARPAYAGFGGFDIPRWPYYAAAAAPHPGAIPGQPPANPGAADALAAAQAQVAAAEQRMREHAQRLADLVREQAALEREHAPLRRDRAVLPIPAAAQLAQQLPEVVQRPRPILPLPAHPAAPRSNALASVSDRKQ